MRPTTTMSRFILLVVFAFSFCSATWLVTTIFEDSVCGTPTQVWATNFATCNPLSGCVNTSGSYYTLTCSDNAPIPSSGVYGNIIYGDSSCQTPPLGAVFTYTKTCVNDSSTSSKMYTCNSTSVSTYSYTSVDCVGTPTVVTENQNQTCSASDSGYTTFLCDY